MLILKLEDTPIITLILGNLKEEKTTDMCIASFTKLSIRSEIWGTKCKSNSLKMVR